MPYSKGSQLLTLLRPAVERVQDLDFLKALQVGMDLLSWIHKFAVNKEYALSHALWRNSNPIVDAVARIVSRVAEHAAHTYVVLDGNNFPGKIRKFAPADRTAQDIIDAVTANLKVSAGLIQLDATEGLDKAVVTDCIALSNLITRDLYERIIERVRGIRGVTVIIAPYEADHQLVYMFRNQLIQLVIAEDSDYALQRCDTLTKLKLRSKSLTGDLIRMCTVEKVATVLCAGGVEGRDAALLTMEPHWSTLKSCEQKCKDSWDLFDCVHRHGLGTFMALSLLTKNDYADVPKVGQVTALGVIKSLGLVTGVEYARELNKLLTGESTDERCLQIQALYDTARVCYDHGIVVDIKQREQRPLEPTPNAAAFAALIGTIEHDPAIVEESMNGRLDHLDRFQLVSMPTFDATPTESVDPDKLPLQRVKLHLAARGIRVPDTAAAARLLLRQTLKVEKVTGPRIFYPPLLRHNAVCPRELPDTSESKATAKPIATQWPEEIQHILGWVTSPAQLAVLTPLVPFRVAYGHTPRGPRVPNPSAEYLADPNTPFHRNIHRASTHFYNQRNLVGLGIFDNSDGTYWARLRVHHSMGSNDVNEPGRTFTAVKLETIATKVGDGILPVATKVLKACCSGCTAGQGEHCWHVFGLLYVLENLKRGDASLAPESSTAGDNAWNRMDAEEKWCDKLKPAACLQITKNKRGHRGTKRRKRSMREGDGGRGALGYDFLPAGIEMADREDPRVIAQRDVVLKCARKANGGKSSAAEILWPAVVSKAGDYKMIPIMDPQYVRTGKPS